MTRTRGHDHRMNPNELDTLAWQFLNSEFAGPRYHNYSLEERIEVFLHHRGSTELLNDGSSTAALQERIMANVGPALRTGVLPATAIAPSR